MKKRVFDLALSGAFLMLASPAIAALYCLTRLTLGKPVFFLQERVGKDGEKFTIYKFRTMSNERDDTGALLPDEKRVTRIGQYLRKTALDELPQIVNIIKGDMSFVGPRPLDPQDYKRNGANPRPEIFSVKPGLTGPSQLETIFSPEQADLKRRLEIDFEYATTPPSILRDSMIMAWTVAVFFKGHNKNKPEPKNSIDPPAPPR